MFEGLMTTAGEGSAIAALAPGLDWRLMLGDEDTDWAIAIRGGAVTAVARGPFVMASWQTRIAAPRAEWQAFLRPVPRPGHHDIIALLRRGAIRFEGDLHPLMANLHYVKLMLASLRGQEIPA